MATSHHDGLDPAGAQTPEAFMRLLRQVRVASGLSLVEVAQRARERGYDFDPVALNRALEDSTLPDWRIVIGLLTVCGVGGEQTDRWMRAYHDLAGPGHRSGLAEAATAVLKPIEVEPVSTPPLMLVTTSATQSRLGPRHLAIAVGVLLVLLVVPLLLLLARFKGGPDTIAAEATSRPPRTAPAPTPTLGEPFVELPSPTEAAPSSPAPVRTSVKPSPRLSVPPPPSPSPSRPPSPSPSNPVVLRSGSLSLTSTQGFDLDTGSTTGTHDIRRVDGTTMARSNSALLEPMSSMPSKQACQAETGWETSVPGLQVGQWLCVRTTDGRFGRLNVTAVGTTLKLAYTIWA